MEIARGYNSADQAGLVWRRDQMRKLMGSGPSSLRENAILCAVEHGIAFPKLWAMVQRPFTFVRRPDVSEYDK